MITIIPGILILWIAYFDDSIPLTGATDLTVKVFKGATIILNQSLTEDTQIPARYNYEWDTTGQELGTVYKICYYKDNVLIFTEDFFLDIIEDDDARAL